MLDRLVTQIEPIPQNYDAQLPRVFRDVLDCHNIILLGDPGMGKTHLFQRTAEYEGAIYKTIRELDSGKFSASCGVLKARNFVSH